MNKEFQIAREAAEWAATREARSPRAALHAVAGVPCATAAFKAAVWARTAGACARAAGHHADDAPTRSHCFARAWADEVAAWAAAAQHHADRAAACKNRRSAARHAARAREIALFLGGDSRPFQPHHWGAPNSPRPAWQPQ